MSQSGQAKKVLIVDDEPDIVSYLEMLLNDGGYETITAGNGNEGLVVIVPAVTGYGGDPYGYKKFLSQMKIVPDPDGFFPKPIDRDALLAKVNELLA